MGSTSGSAKWLNKQQNHLHMLPIFTLLSILITDVAERGFMLQLGTYLYGYLRILRMQVDFV